MRKPGKVAGKPRSPVQPGDAAQSAQREALEHYELRLYVAGQTQRSLTALSNLKAVCEQHLHGKYRVEIIDLLAHPELASQDQILAIPTLVRKLPAPMKRIIGDLSNTEKVLVGLNILKL